MSVSSFGFPSQSDFFALKIRPQETLPWAIASLFVQQANKSENGDLFIFLHFLQKVADFNVGIAIACGVEGWHCQL
ncbi:hypothetical protein [Nostoc sp.]|uniref:hypothetical protein n=1 Tax=Nostoc sp. TaxID=1180 RepID=UPI002FFB3843